jgi:hypothetical protein
MVRAVRVVRSVHAKRFFICFAVVGILGGTFFGGVNKPVFGQVETAMDTVFARKVREYTTDPRFLSDLVDHLPEVPGIPSPRDYFGDIIGAPGVLHYTEEIYGYLAALAKASPRVLFREIGVTEEGRKMVECIIAEEETLKELEKYRRFLNQLADPRKISPEQAQKIIQKGKPIYYAMGGLHSPETGSPEMLMELAYRLATEESTLIREIRKNLIFIFVPVAEPDGRDRMVDIYQYRKDHNGVGPSLIYWGHYVAHDNNRDGFGLALNLTRNVLRSFLYWKPTVMHDLHESVPYLYVSTGTGPYNEYIDAITIDEWHNLAHEEVTELTKRGMPGVWTHGFYTGWAANYLMWIANTRNAVGRFYETFGNMIPETVERKLPRRSTSREWYRPNPPLRKVQWSMRNNTNYMETGVLVALHYVARHRQRFLDNFYRKSKKAVEKGRKEKPYAYVIPKEQRRYLAAADLVNLLLAQGLEIHVADENFRWKEPGKKGKEKKEKYRRGKKGDYIIRLDQPYRTLARILLDRQNFPADQRAPYDDTGWTLPLLRQVQCFAVNDSAILAVKMHVLADSVRVAGRLKGKGKYYLVNNTTEDHFALLRFRLEGVKVWAAEEPFKAAKREFAAGSYIIPAEGNPPGLYQKLASLARELGLEIVAVSRKPEVPTHEVELPRIALVHTWVATPQDAGWWRLAFDRIGIPYTYLAEQDLAHTDLSQFDVIILPRTWANTQRLIAGTTDVGDPIPWKRTEKYRHIGTIDETDDVRKGMGYDGVKNLARFIRRGGVFITEGSTCSFPIDVGLVRRVSIRRTQKLLARGTVLRSKIADPKSPITYGFPDTLAVYFNRGPVFRINKSVGNYLTPDWLKDEIWYKEVPRVVLSFPKKRLLLSGVLRGEQEMAGAPAVVDVPVGDGHVVLFAIRPFWRWETHGSHALVWNTILHWNDLRTGWPERKEEEQEERGYRPGDAVHWDLLLAPWMQQEELKQ